MGFNALRRFGPTDGWTCEHASQARRLNGRSIHISADSNSPLRTAFLPVRAHVSFVPLIRPRLIFVGVTDRLLEDQMICKSDRPRDEMASTSGLRLPSVIRRPDPGVWPCAAILPWALPLAGFDGHDFAVHRPGSSPRPIISLRNPRRPILSPETIPIRSWVWRRSFPSRFTFRRGRSCSARRFGFVIAKC